MTTIRIVTDSAGDIPDDICEKLNIRVIPAFLNFGDESYPDDGKALTREAFYERLKTTTVLPSTAAPPTGLGEKIFREALQEADAVVALAVSQKLSSIHDGMVLAAQNVSMDRITVLDSGTLSMGEGWQTILAAEAVAQGATIEEVKVLVQDVRSRIRVWATLDTLEFLRRSGRVSWVRASIGAVLNIKPIIAAWNGEVRSEGRVRTMDKAVKQLAELARQEAPLDCIAVMHANNRQTAEQLKNLVQDLVAPERLLIVPATPVIGTHVGPGAVGIAVVKSKI